MADKFPGPYRNNIPQDLDNPDPMVVRVPLSHTGVGARKSTMAKTYQKPGGMAIKHTPDLNSH